MGKSKWPDFLFTVAVRFFVGVVLGCVLSMIVGYRGILRSFSHNHVKAVEFWVGLCGLIGGLVALFTTPRWQTPWYQGIRSPAAWNGLDPGIRRQEIIGRLGQPSGRSTAGEDVWRQGKWELRVSYDENEQAVDIVRQAVLK